MTDSNNSQWWLRPHISRRAALRAAILGATIPGALYLAKAADSADAADDDIYIPGAPNFLELGHGWPGKEANAGKITYRQWSDALDIVGAGTEPGYRKVKIWDDLYVQGLLNLRAYIVDPEVPRAWTAFLYAKDVNGQSKPFWKDATGTAQPLVARSATLVVAASNASPQGKLGADYVCDGFADEEEINAAIAALPSAGGKVVLTEGSFNIASTITLGYGDTLEGQGSRATLLSALSAITVVKLSASNAQLRGVMLSGHHTATTAIHVDGHACYLENIYVNDFNGTGIYLDDAINTVLNYAWVDNCVYGVDLAAGCYDTQGSDIQIGASASPSVSTKAGLRIAAQAGTIQWSNLHVYGYQEAIHLSQGAGVVYLSNVWLHDNTRRNLLIEVTDNNAIYDVYISNFRIGQASRGSPDTYPDVDIVQTAAGGPITRIHFSNGLFQYDTTRRQIAAVRMNSSAGGTHGPICFDHCEFVDYPTVFSVTGPWDYRVRNCGGYVTENTGKSIQSGDGSTTAFNIPHGCDVMPTSVYATPGHADCALDFYVSAVNGTNITVTFASAPPSGTNNVVLHWRAEA